jgi:hypothetical protein
MAQSSITADGDVWVDVSRWDRTVLRDLTKSRANAAVQPRPPIAQFTTKIRKKRFANPYVLFRSAAKTAVGIRHMKASNVAALLSFLVASISMNVDLVAAETSKTSIECTVARVAERYIATHYPDFDSVKNPPIVRDNGKIWIVEYQLPEGMIGGTPRIEIEKGSFKVLRALHTQ